MYNTGKEEGEPSDFSCLLKGFYISENTCSIYRNRHMNEWQRQQTHNSLASRVFGNPSSWLWHLYETPTEHFRRGYHIQAFSFLIPLNTGLIWLSRELPGVRSSSLCSTCLSHTFSSPSPQSWHGLNTSFIHPSEHECLLWEVRVAVRPSPTHHPPGMFRRPRDLVS